MRCRPGTRFCFSQPGPASAVHHFVPHRVRGTWPSLRNPSDVRGCSTDPDKFLSVNNIEVVYSSVILVLKGVSLSVPKGGIVALLGANGAGKTTTLKAISNLLHAERGEVTKGAIVFDGDEVHRLSPNELVHARLHPGHGGPPLLRPSHRRGKSPDRRLHPPRRQGRGRGRSRAGLFVLPAAQGAPRIRPPATPPAASSRCARSAAR